MSDKTLKWLAGVKKGLLGINYKKGEVQQFEKEFKGEIYSIKAGLIILSIIQNILLKGRILISFLESFFRSAFPSPPLYLIQQFWGQA